MDCRARCAGRKVKSVVLLQQPADRSLWLWDSQWPATRPRPRGHRSFTRRDRWRAGTVPWGAPNSDHSSSWRAPSEGLSLVRDARPATPSSLALARARDSPVKDGCRNGRTAWRAIGSPTAKWSDPLDGGAVPQVLALATGAPNRICVTVRGEARVVQTNRKAKNQHDAELAPKVAERPGAPHALRARL
jgi:hypothetical protein